MTTQSPRNGDKIQQTAIKCNKIPKGIQQHTTQYHKIQQNTTIWQQNTTKYNYMPQNTTKYHKIPQDDHKIPQNTTQWPQKNKKNKTQSPQNYLKIAQVQQNT